ncbi:uncharacterized membrane protein YeiH [Jatrophihabitans sp. GAS493]|uniref:trimeric intracellular cation channel family protein n=1 Tax=Jatrophihabitans sp. GAS493 TaxID=1907575 RepID=UPI000BB8CC13|nr:trimeric intracellular cation channel family protein [Jatrophihabitans sp. GAS493]SOD74094.1 uncharacterized membrane protein YeiH [Jatrophihabitans sp. GAS493]
MSPHLANLEALDLVGIFVFALSGGLAGVRAHLDIFGLVVMATITSIGGGLIRDVLLGDTPPAALRHWPYLAVPAIAAVIVFFRHPQIAKVRRPMLILDAAGLALFTVAATRQALVTGLDPAGSCMVGVIAGIGGGVLRDVLLREIPVVLRSEIYAVAAAAGAVLVAIGYAVDHLNAVWMTASALVIFGLRVVSLRRHWTAPRAPDTPPVR